MRIILASKSERRKYLLEKIFPEFEIMFPDVEEIFEGNSPESIAVRNAEKKAIDVAGRIRNKDCTIISADTIVAVGNKILGKPKDQVIAKEYLLLLSGTKHRVITGVCLFNPLENKMLSDFDVTFVLFRKLTAEQIDSFLNRKTFHDKAGGYAVQETNDEFIELINGSYDNVVGLPVEKLREMLDQFNKLPEIEIHDIAFPDGWGVGKYNGKIVFVERALPGDKLWGKIIKHKPGYCYVKNCGVINGSHYRVKPPCPHFGMCGGCILQDLDYGVQIELKRKYLIETLTRIGKIENGFEVSNIIPSPDRFFYRNKMEFAFGTQNNSPVLGLRERQSPLKKYAGNVYSVRNCFIFSDCVEKIFPIFLKYICENNLEPYNPFTKKGFVRHLIIREAKQTKQIMVVLVTRSGTLPGLSKLADTVSSVQNLISFWWVENNQVSDVVSFQKKHLVFGSPFIEEKIKEMKFRIYPETFFQPNTKAAEKMYSAVENMIESDSLPSILGLFCGSGAIEIFLSQKAGNVVGVDNNSANISTAEENCATNNIKNCNFHCQTSEEFLSLISRDKKKFDLLVVDPPRGGLTNRAIKRILQLRIARIIYVSCNPATLARDLSILTGNGYVLKKVVPVDMFPHTTHVESCCLLETG